jgi:hypothetical protein
MNNSKLFGPIIYEKTPLEMIEAGVIIRPRIHLVDVSNESDKMQPLDKHVHAIIESFKEHATFCSYMGRKLLVVANDSEELDGIVSHPEIKNMLDISTNLKIFDISARFKPRINGEPVSREIFLENLRTLTDNDNAIILHINILTEGIDVPGITGVMILGDMGFTRFLQNLGRASRLHERDRNKLNKNTLNYNDLDHFTKPYAWIIIPVYGPCGKDLRKKMTEIIYSLRNYGFRASQDVVIKQHNKNKIESLEMLNEKDTRANGYLQTFIEIQNYIEEKEKADKLDIERYNIQQMIENESDEELIKSFE